MELLIGLIVVVPIFIGAVNSRYNEAPWLLFRSLFSLTFGALVGWLIALLFPLYVPVLGGLVAYLWLFYRSNEQFREAIQRVAKKF